MTRRPSLRPVVALVAAAAIAGAAAAQSVVLAGSIGQSKAVLMIDGQPVTLAVGASARGVTLKRLVEGDAEVEVGGRVERLRLGGTPVRSGAAPTAADRAIVIAAGPGGHFTASGAINGQAVQFMVDTGATTVALSQAEATRLGLDWRHGRPGLSQSAGGAVPFHAINLTRVRVGDVEVANVDAIVVPAEMPMVLLGNSFLERFSMVREADVMRLERKP
jgi:aspartyl protease family protein